MKLGILADIHEDAPKLALALRRLRQERVQQVVVLGDVVFEMGSRLHETIALLAGAGAVGVWGNHDLGLCYEPDQRMKERCAGPVLDFMRTLQPRLELGGCLFTHGLPYYDATDPIVYYLGERPETAEGLARSFAASDHAVLFVGHFHRWLVASPRGPLPWQGTEPILLRADERYLVVVAAVCDGWCAVFDTDRRELTPFRLPGATDDGSGSPLPKDVLETERLLVRQFTEADAEALLLMEREPDVLRYVGRKPLADVEAYRTKIRSTFLPYYEKPGGYGAWAIIEKMSGEFIGGCSLRPGRDSNTAGEMGYGPDDVELGYGLRKPSWGRGYATELVQALVRKAFTELGAVSLVASVTVDNVASVRVLEKAGLRRVGEPICLPREDELSVKYALTKDQFDHQRG